MPYERRSEQGTICSAKVRARPGGADATVLLSRGLPSGSRGRRGAPRQRGQQPTPPASPERPAPLPAVLFARRARSDQLEVQGRVVDQPAYHGDPAAVISTAAPRTDPLRERLPAEARHDRVVEHDVRAVARMLEPHTCVTDSRGRRPRTDRRAIAPAGSRLKRRSHGWLTGAPWNDEAGYPMLASPLGSGSSVASTGPSK
jgi:hypothetical protein